jgi:hypothetical protein
MAVKMLVTLVVNLVVVSVGGLCKASLNILV